MFQSCPKLTPKCWSRQYGPNVFGLVPFSLISWQIPFAMKCGTSFDNVPDANFYFVHHHASSFQTYPIPLHFTSNHSSPFPTCHHVISFHQNAAALIYFVHTSRLNETNHGPHFFPTVQNMKTSRNRNTSFTMRTSSTKNKRATLFQILMPTSTPNPTSKQHTSQASSTLSSFNIPAHIISFFYSSRCFYKLCPTWFRSSCLSWKEKLCPSFSSTIHVFPVSLFELFCSPKESTHQPLFASSNARSNGLLDFTIASRHFKASSNSKLQKPTFLLLFLHI